MWRREFLRKREQAYAEAMKPRYGDTRTFAYHASKKGWRARWSLAQRLRAEELITYVHPLKQPKQRPLDKFLGGAGNRAPAARNDLASQGATRLPIPNLAPPTPPAEMMHARSEPVTLDFHRTRTPSTPNRAPTRAGPGGGIAESPPKSLSMDGDGDAK